MERATCGVLQDARWKKRWFFYAEDQTPNKRLVPIQLMHHITTCLLKFVADLFGFHQSKIQLTVPTSKCNFTFWSNNDISYYLNQSSRVPEEKNIKGNGDLNLRRQEVDPKEPVRIHPRPGTRPSVRPNAMKNRGKQLEALKQMEERIQRLQV